MPNKTDNYMSTLIQYYPNDIHIVKPLGTLTLGQFLNSIKNPKPDIESQFKKIAEASAEGNKKLKDELKSKLYYTTPCIFSDGTNRTYQAIDHFTGIAVLDFDNISVDLACELRDYLFNTYPFIIASFLSSSRKGVKCLVRIPVVNSVDEFKLYFYGLGCIFQFYKGFDITSQNSALAFYLTYDHDALVREDAAVFQDTGYKEDEFKEFKGEAIKVEDVTEKDREIILRQMYRIFDNIIDNGHVPLRGASLLFGGFCASGYYEIEEARGILYDLVDATPYLQSKSRTYKRTVNDMLIKGYTSPIYLERHAEYE